MAARGCGVFVACMMWTIHDEDRKTFLSSIFSQSRSLNDVSYARPLASLRRMPGMLHSIPDWVQSVSKRFVPRIFYD